MRHGRSIIYQHRDTHYRHIPDSAAAVKPVGLLLDPRCNLKLQPYVEVEVFYHARFEIMMFGETFTI